MSKRLLRTVLFGFFAATAVSAAFTDSAGTVPNPTGLVVTDEKSQQYNIDSILDLNKVLVIHTTYSG